MELSDYLRLMRTRWVSMLALAVLGLLIGAAFSLTETPRFTAKTQLFVSVKSVDTTADLMQGSSFSEKRVASYINLVTSPRVLQQVSDKLNLHVSPDALRSQISASTPKDTVLLDIQAADTDAQRAADLTNATAEAVIQMVQEVESGSIVKLSVVEKASAPSHPSSPNIPMNLAVGLALGLLVGYGSAIARHLFDTRIRGLDSLQKITEAPVLGRFAPDSSVAKKPLVTDEGPYSLRAEGYRQLRTHLLFTNLDGAAQTVVVTSAIPGEGKTTTAANLAILYAESGVRVLLVDADLRRPRVASILGLEGSVGLTTVLSGQIELEEAIQTWGSAGSLHVLTAGLRAPNPSELLGSRRMQELLERMEQSYDVILLDSPPILPVTDPAVLGAISNGIVLVASLDGRLRKDELARAIQNIEAVDAKLLGLVLNRVETRAGEASYYEYLPDSPKQVDELPTRRKSSGARQVNSARR